jgi:hypothetical protein
MGDPKWVDNKVDGWRGAAAARFGEEGRERM